MTGTLMKCPKCGGKGMCSGCTNDCCCCEGTGKVAPNERPAPRVLNIKDSGGQVPPGAVYVARPTKFGNPYIIGKHGTREEVIAKYRERLLASPDLLARLGELRGRDLVCFCSPLKCHADILLAMSNAPEAP